MVSLKSASLRSRAMAAVGVCLHPLDAASRAAHAAASVVKQACHLVLDVGEGITDALLPAPVVVLEKTEEEAGSLPRRVIHLVADIGWRLQDVLVYEMSRIPLAGMLVTKRARGVAPAAPPPPQIVVEPPPRVEPPLRVEIPSDLELSPLPRAVSQPPIKSERVTFFIDTPFTSPYASPQPTAERTSVLDDDFELTAPMLSPELGRAAVSY